MPQSIWVYELDKLVLELLHNIWLTLCFSFSKVRSYIDVLRTKGITETPAQANTYSTTPAYAHAQYTNWCSCTMHQSGLHIQLLAVHRILCCFEPALVTAEKPDQHCQGVHKNHLQSPIPLQSHNQLQCLHVSARETQYAARCTAARHAGSDLGRRPCPRTDGFPWLPIPFRYDSCLLARSSQFLGLEST